MSPTAILYTCTPCQQQLTRQVQLLYLALTFHGSQPASAPLVNDRRWAFSASLNILPWPIRDSEELLERRAFERSGETEGRSFPAVIRDAQDAKEVFAAVVLIIEETVSGVSAPDLEATKRLDRLGYDLSLHQRRGWILSQWKVVWQSLPDWGAFDEVETGRAETVQNALSALDRYVSALLEVIEERQVEERKVDQQSSEELERSPAMSSLLLASSLFRALRAAWPGEEEIKIVLPSDREDLPVYKKN